MTRYVLLLALCLLTACQHARELSQAQSLTLSGSSSALSESLLQTLTVRDTTFLLYMSALPSQSCQSLPSLPSEVVGASPVAAVVRHADIKAQHDLTSASHVSDTVAMVATSASQSDKSAAIPASSARTILPLVLLVLAVYIIPIIIGYIFNHHAQNH